MEKFMYLFRSNHVSSGSDNAPSDYMQKWGQWIKSLAEKGNYVAGDPLHNVGKQVNGTKKIITDGPFVETKEIVGGYLIVNAKDINEAVEMSKDCPVFLVDGKVEVRPIQKMEM